jgi:hypothetical protein
VLVLLAACYQGGEREKEPPPGYPGGFCLAPDGHCVVGMCDVMGGAAYCYDPQDPCKGVFCGGHGACVITPESKPACMCDAGFSNEMFALFCAVDGGTTADSGGESSSGALPDMGGS